MKPFSKEDYEISKREQQKRVVWLRQHIGHIIGVWQNLNNISDEEFIKRSGLTAKQFECLRRERTKPLSISVLQRASEYMGVDMVWFFVAHR